MRGTSNITAAFVDGESLPADLVDDAAGVLTTADDDAAFEFYGLEAAGFSIQKGFMPLRKGPFVLGNGAARTLSVQPMRIARSAIDSVTNPRALLSYTLDAEAGKALPTVPTAGLWGYELLYAQLVYVDASNPTKGTTVTWLWATAPTYVVFAVAANFAALPADTSTTWNVPIAYVRNFAGQTICAQEDIIEFPPAAGAELAEGLRRLSAAKMGGSSGRCYSSANNDPTKLVLGGTSKWVATAAQGILTTQITPVVVCRRNVEHVRREFLIPYCAAGSFNGTAGTDTGAGAVAVASLVIDDTRDWRGANFRVEMWVPNVNATQFGEEDPSVTDPRVFPCMGTTGVIGACSQFVSVGQSWTAIIPLAAGPWDSRLWAAVFGANADLPGAGVANASAVTPIASGSGMGIWVDPGDGFLKWYVKKAGSGSGFPAWILIEAWFGHHIPV